MYLCNVVLWVQQPRRTMSLVQRWTASGAFHHWASTSWQLQSAPTLGTDRSLIPSALARHSSAQPRCPGLSSLRTVPSHLRPHAEQPPPGPSAGFAVESGPAAGARANSPVGTTSRRGPSPLLFLRSFREGVGQDPASAPWVANGRPNPPHPPRRAQAAGGLRPFPGRPRLLAPAPGRAAGSGNGAPAASRPPPRSCIGPATWPTEGAGITRGPGQAGREAAAGVDAGLTRLLGCPWARPAQPNPGRRKGLGVTFRRAAGSWRCRRPGGRRGRGPPPAGRRLPPCSAGPPRWRCAAARTARSRTRRGSLPSLLCLPRRPSLRSARGEARVSGCRERGGWRRVCVSPAAADDAAKRRRAGSPPGGGSGRPACHTAAPAPIGSRRRSGPRRAVRSRPPPPLSPAKRQHRSPKPEWRGRSKKDPVPGAPTAAEAPGSSAVPTGRSSTSAPARGPAGVAPCRVTHLPFRRPAGVPASLERLWPDWRRQVAAV